MVNKIKSKWWDINIDIKEIVIAKYDKIKDWKMDPKGYFIIKINNNKIETSYVVVNKIGKEQTHTMVAKILGTTAIDIVNTIIKKKYISSMQHVADMGIELHKAEIALKYDFKEFDH